MDRNDSDAVRLEGRAGGAGPGRAGEGFSGRFGIFVSFPGRMDRWPFAGRRHRVGRFTLARRPSASQDRCRPGPLSRLNANNP
ncbi:hypothetical protein Aau02nite_15490 [Amorphoplanes auranticolor]|uniref:Uncharacterized protein n=1 Tax=Actinoplanes auranticolor TaxID=47988 RepID=A0A919VH81_9ACTN|nr:hypothetical protein Aau02nite_15490 [Actinoplanes auranticolor]